MGDGRVTTADDVADWLHCPRLAVLRSRSPELAGPMDSYATLLTELSRIHRQRAIEATPGVVRVPYDRSDWQSAMRATRRAMSAGALAVAPGVLAAEDERGVLLSAPALLFKDGEGYAPREIMLARSIRAPEHLMRLAFHAEVIARVTGHRPVRGSVVLGNGRIADLSLKGSASLSLAIDGICAARAGVDWPGVAYASHRCGSCRFSKACLSRFHSEHDLSLVYDLNTTSWQALRERGVTRYDDLAKATPDTLGKVRGLAVSRVPRAVAQAQALVTGKAQLLAAPSLPASAIFLDLEGYPDDDQDYLWGVLDDGHYVAHVAEGDDGDRRVFEAFLDHWRRVRERDATTRIVHYGTYEAIRLRRYARRHGGPKGLLRSVEEALFDLHREVRRALVAPVTSYGLKAVAHAQGFEWRIRGSSAAWSIARYRSWKETGDPAILDELKSYNEDDVRATAHVFNCLKSGLA